MIAALNNEPCFSHDFRLEEIPLNAQIAMRVAIPSSIAFAAMAVCFTLPMSWIGGIALRVLIHVYVAESTDPSQNQDDAQIRSTAWKTTVLFFIRQGLSFGLGLFFLSQALAVPLGVYMGSFSAASLADSLVKSMGFLAFGLSFLQEAFEWEEPEKLLTRIYRNLKGAFSGIEGDFQDASLSSTERWKSLFSDEKHALKILSTLRRRSKEESIQSFAKLEQVLSDDDFLYFYEGYFDPDVLEKMQTYLPENRQEAFQERITRLSMKAADANEGIDEGELFIAEGLAPLWHLYQKGWRMKQTEKLLRALNVLESELENFSVDRQFQLFCLKQGIKTNKDFKDLVLRNLKENPTLDEVYNHVLSFFRGPRCPYYLYLGCVFLLTLYKFICNPAILGYMIIGFISLGCIGDVKSPWNGVTLSSLFEEDYISGENIFTFIALEAFRALMDSNPELPFGALSAISAGSYLFDQVGQFVS